MGVVTNNMASFMAVHKTSEQIEDQQPFDQYIASILEALVPIH